jgi:hypothetical protein
MGLSQLLFGRKASRNIEGSLLMIFTLPQYSTAFARKVFLEGWRLAGSNVDAQVAFAPGSRPLGRPLCLALAKRCCFAKGTAADFRHGHRAIKPILGLSKLEIELSAGLRQPGSVTEPRQLVVYRF